MSDITKLQNGSDIRGIALPGVEGEEVNLDNYDAIAIAEAFVYWLALKLQKSEYNLNICIGCDSRLSGEDLKKDLMRGICMMGSHCEDAGLASTPAMFMSTILPVYEFDGAIMITASHLPWNRNGFKFFTAEGGLEKEDIAAILKRASTIHPIAEHYECEETNVMEMYAAHLRSLISRKVKGKLDGMKIVVDAGNGVGGFFATEVLAPLGADVSASQFLEPDGHFPNHIPNPENSEAMASICHQVKAAGADLGIIFDTDVDRSAAVTSQGLSISRNAIVALAAALEAEEHPGGTVVTDSITSNELHTFLEDNLGLKHYRYRRGYRNVINKAKELSEQGEDAFLAIETSGHAAYSDNYYLDDGAHLACLIVAAAAKLKKKDKGIEALIADLESPAADKEYRFDLNPDNFVEIGTQILDKMPEWVASTPGLSLEEPNYEGVRVNFTLNEASGWFLLRKSLHDPVLPLNVEATSEQGIADAISLITEYLSQFEGIDLSILE
jgi:phosphomannomutase